MRSPRLSKVQWILGVLLVVVVAIQFTGMPGCATPEQIEQFKNNSQRATDIANETDAEIKKLEEEKFGLETALTEANVILQQTRREYQEVKAELEQQIRDAENETERQRIQDLIAAQEAALSKAEDTYNELASGLDEFTNAIMDKIAVKDKALAIVNDLNAKIQRAESIPDIVAVAGTTIAPMTGPIAPWVLLGTNILSVILSGRYNQRKTASHIVGPIEGARNRELESKLNAEAGDGGPNYIVVEKRPVAAAHMSNGAGDLIRMVTNG